MIAILRYAFLKSMRDSSLIAFLIIPMLTPLAALAGVTLGKGHFHYPFYLNVQYSPVQNAMLAGQIATVICTFFALIPAFWTFRPEIATRSINAFFFAARPLTVTLSLILFAAAIGVVGWIGALATIGVLTTALPPHVGFLLLTVAIGCLATSALGALAVSISAQPAGIVVAYIPFLILMLPSKESKSLQQLLAAIVVSIVCAGLSAFFLERRCAT